MSLLIQLYIAFNTNHSSIAIIFQSFCGEKNFELKKKIKLKFFFFQNAYLGMR